MTLTDATTRPEAVVLPISPTARALIAGLAVEYAREVLDHEVDWSDTAMALIYHRNALRRAADQLAKAASADSDHRPPPCGGTGAFVLEDAVDGNTVATCPTCRRHRLAVHVEGRWWAIEAHPARHLAACTAAGPVRCICPLADDEEPF